MTTAGYRKSLSIVETYYYWTLSIDLGIFDVSYVSEAGYAYIIRCNWAKEIYAVDTFSSSYSVSYVGPIHQVDDRLCGLVVRVLGYSSRRPGSIPGATRSCEK
jgi:hypothetical protein